MIPPLIAATASSRAQAQPSARLGGQCRRAKQGLVLAFTVPSAPPLNENALQELGASLVTAAARRASSASVGTRRPSTAAFEDGGLVALEVGLDALEVGDGFVEAGELLFDFGDDAALDIAGGNGSLSVSRSPRRRLLMFTPRAFFVI